MERENYRRTNGKRIFSDEKSVIKTSSEWQREIAEETEEFLL